MFSSQCPRACYVIISFSFSSSTKLLKVPYARDKTDYLFWSDEEVEFWFSSTMHYKTWKEIESMDWESCQSKYQDIHDKFVEHYPTPEGISKRISTFRNSNDESDSNIQIEEYQTKVLFSCRCW